MVETEQVLIPESSSTEPLWHVAMGDDQIGPLSVADLQRMIREGDVDDTCLAWTDGMEDWLPLGDLPQYAHLLEEQEAATKAPAEPEMVTWVPQASAELADLVQKELTKKAPEPREDETPSSIDLPDFSRQAFGAALPTAEAGRWRLPSRPAETQSRWLRHALFGGLVVVGCTVGVVAGVLMAPRSGSEPSDELRKASLEPAVSNQPTESPQQNAVTVDANKSKPTTETKPIDAEPDGKADAKDHRKAGKNPKKKPVPKITKKQVNEAARAQAPSLEKCVRAAIKDRELAPGRYEFIASWTIRANGSVGKPRLVSPERVKGTSLPRCFAGVMSGWTFPAPGTKVNVSRFRVGGVTVR